MSSEREARPTEDVAGSGESSGLIVTLELPRCAFSECGQKLVNGKECVQVKSETGDLKDTLYFHPGCYEKVSEG